MEKFLLSNFLWSHTLLFGHILVHIHYNMWPKSGVWDHKKFDSKDFSTVYDKISIISNFNMGIDLYQYSIFKEEILSKVQDLCSQLY